ncbi:hypothetical protein DFH07DRAFT_954610 [Mycena maculata]|uniref:Uncharacterized protein n=1 Tax=Mycena maculata TaxID=230809 RepID=A0AAD7NN84_9AGAR|nr:hypothetical protein DFH07DRAFT_954610 [Mycena maculata]
MPIYMRPSTCYLPYTLYLHTFATPHLPPYTHPPAGNDFGAFVASSSSPLTFGLYRSFVDEPPGHKRIDMPYYTIPGGLVFDTLVVLQSPSTAVGVFGGRKSLRDLEQLVS